MTNHDEMPDEIWAVPYEDMGHGEWDECKWTKCPFVENDKRPKYETKYIRADHLAAQGYLRQGWQKIETAPRDGTKFYGYNGQVVRDVMWSEKRKDFDVNGYSCLARGYTHWMPQEPLPQPPKGDE